MTPKQSYIMELLKEWLSPQKVSKELGVSISTLSRWRRERLHLPYHKMGKYIKYRRSDITAFLESNKIETLK